MAKERRDTAMRVGISRRILRTMNFATASPCFQSAGSIPAMPGAPRSKRARTKHKRLIAPLTGLPPTKRVAGGNHAMLCERLCQGWPIDGINGTGSWPKTIAFRTCRISSQQQRFCICDGMCVNMCLSLVFLDSFCYDFSQQINQASSGSACNE